MNLITIKTGSMYRALDVFFVFFHSLLILFNLSGWIWHKTRIANLVTLILTGASWFLLGIFFGPGFCPLTDLHFHILAQLGHENLPSSYIEYLVERISGKGLNGEIIDVFTLSGYFISLLISSFLNLRDYKRRKN